MRTYKSICDLTKGDLIKVQCGDYDNWCIFIFDSYEIEKDNWIKINYHEINEKETSESLYHYGKITDELEIVGKEE